METSSESSDTSLVHDESHEKPIPRRKGKRASVKVDESQKHVKDEPVKQPQQGPKRMEEDDDVQKPAGKNLLDQDDDSI